LNQHNAKEFASTTLESLSNQLVGGSQRYNLLLTDNLTIYHPLQNDTVYTASAALRDISLMVSAAFREINDESVEELANSSPSEGLLFLLHNRPLFATYYKKYCDYFSDDYNNNNHTLFEIIGILVGVGIAYHIFLFVTFIVAVTILLRSRNDILRVLREIPKDIAGTVHHSLRRKKKQEDHNITNKKILPIRLKIAAM
jgi:ribosomal protein S17E